MPLTSCMTFADDAASPDELVEAAEMAAAVRHAIAGLADGQRDAVLLFYLHGLTHREVAAELAISVGAVKSRLHQARTALAPTLAPLVKTDKTAEPPPISQTPERQWIAVSVSEVRRDGVDDPARRRHVIVLRELSGSRELPAATRSSPDGHHYCSVVKDTFEMDELIAGFIPNHAPRGAQATGLKERTGTDVGRMRPQRCLRGPGRLHLRDDVVKKSPS